MTRAHFDYDAIIVGAGPAGLATAIALGDRGHRVLVVEQRTGIIDKACGEGLLPPAVELLAAMRVTFDVTPGHVQPLYGVRYHVGDHALEASFRDSGAANERIASGPHPGLHGLGVRRTTLARALHNRLRELPHVVVRQGMRALGVSLDAHAATLHLDGGPVRAPLVVGADGLHSRVREWAGLRGSPSTVRRFGLRAHFELRAPSHWVDVFLEPRAAGRTHAGMEAYLTPVGGTLANVAFLWRAPLPDGFQASHLPHMLERFPEVRDRLTSAVPETRPRASGPFLQRARRRAATGVALVGDAGGYVDAMTGEGVGLGLLHAQWLAITVDESLRRAAREGRSVDAHELAPYDAGIRHATGSHDRLTRMLVALSRSPRVQRAALEWLAQIPTVLRWLVRHRSRPWDLTRMRPDARNQLDPSVLTRDRWSISA